MIWVGIGIGGVLVAGWIAWGVYERFRTAPPLDQPDDWPGASGSQSPPDD